MTFKRLLKISRPRFWIYELGPYVVGLAAALGTHSTTWLSLPVIIFFIFFSYPANIYIYGINDSNDYETDKLNPKKSGYEALVSPADQKPLLAHIFIVCTPFFVYAYFVASLSALLSLVAFFFFAGFYSATPIRAKSKPLLDSFFSASHYIATAAFSFFLVASSNPFITIHLSSVGLCLITGICWAMAMHAYSAVPDIKADAGAGLKTIATSLGKKKTIVLCGILYAVSGILSYPFIGLIGLALSLFYVLFMILSYPADEKKLFRLYTFFPFINTIAGALIFFATLLKF